jgi:hypothetical protein
MNANNRISNRSNVIDLRQIVEPLANYICATDQPRQALASAIAVLFREVEATNQAAIAHFQSHLAN